MPHIECGPASFNLITMKYSDKADDLLRNIDEKTRLGDLRTMAKAIKKDHALALELWKSGGFMARQLAILIMDAKVLSTEVVDGFCNDILSHPEEEQNQLIDWLMANQLTKTRQTIAMMESWKDSRSVLQRRVFWYYQGRLRWMGQTPPENTAELLAEIEARLMDEAPQVQWAMNFTAGWIGVFDRVYRERCVGLGEKTGLYKGDMVSRGCTPNYLPEFIGIESKKRSL